MADETAAASPAGDTTDPVPESSAEQQQSHSQGRTTTHSPEEKPAADKVGAGTVGQADPTTCHPPNTSSLSGHGGNSSSSSNSAAAIGNINSGNNHAGTAPTTPTPTGAAIATSASGSASSSIGESGSSSSSSSPCGNRHVRSGPNTSQPTRSAVPSGSSYNQPGGSRPHASSPQAGRQLGDSSGRAGKGTERQGGGLLGALLGGAGAVLGGAGAVAGTVLGGAGAALGRLGKAFDTMRPHLVHYSVQIGVTVVTSVAASLALMAVLDSMDHNKEMRRIKASILGDGKLDITLADVGGLDHITEELRERILEPLKHIHLFKSSLAEVERGVLLHGPPGTGKTMLAKALARESGMSFIVVSPSRLMGKYYGETEQRVSALWALARKFQPAVIFIDEVDALFKARGSGCDSDVSRTMLTQFLQLWDGIERGRERIVVMGATNRKDDLDEAVLRRFTMQFKEQLCRFALHFSVDLPGEAQRASILRCQLRKFEREEGPGSVEAQLLEEGSAVLSSIAQRTQDCCGSDLRQLLVQAVRLRMREVIAASGGDKVKKPRQPKESSSAGKEPGNVSAKAGLGARRAWKMASPDEEEQLASGSGSSGAAADAAAAAAAVAAAAAAAAADAAARAAARAAAAAARAASMSAAGGKAGAAAKAALANSGSIAAAAGSAASSSGSPPPAPSQPALQHCGKKGERGAGHAAQGAAHAAKGAMHATKGAGHATKGVVHATEGAGHAAEGAGHAAKGAGHAAIPLGLHHLEAALKKLEPALRKERGPVGIYT